MIELTNLPCPILVNDPDEENPFEKPALQEAWTEGYRAGVEEADIPKTGKYIYDRVEKDLAWVKGYTAALLVE